MVKGTVEDGNTTKTTECSMAILPKPLKDHGVLKGYRIITMANVWVQIMEKVLVVDLESRNCLSERVGGARPKRSTAVTHEIQQGMQNSHHATVGLYDLQQSYTDPMLEDGDRKYLRSVQDYRKAHL